MLKPNSETAQLSAVTEAQALISWYQSSARPLLNKYAPDHLALIDNDLERLSKILARDTNITVCFLGHSGVGKSTLLNAVAAGAEQVLPAGGIGPLTALATEVHYSRQPSFTAQYHKRAHLWRVVFALEHGNFSGDSAGETDPQIPLDELAQQDRQELHSDLIESVGGSGQASLLSTYIKQARQLITGDQFSDRGLPYLVDALRRVCGYGQLLTQEFDRGDLDRIQRLQEALQLAEENVSYVQQSSENNAEFLQDLKAHAAGFLAPLIRKIEVGWPSDLLLSGVRLVDLPGVGIAQDTYRQVTREYIRERARAVVLVVDRAGPTADTVELLRTSGYWDRLVGAADDPGSDPCALIVAVTKVDDVAQEEWRNSTPSDRRPKKGEIYGQLVSQFKERMRKQIADQLGEIGGTSNEAVSAARKGARDNIIDTLLIQPVSAPEYRKLLLDDDDDRPFLRTEPETGVPDLKMQLQELATQHRLLQREHLESVSARMRQSIKGELARIEALSQESQRAAEEAERLEVEVEAKMAPKRKERDQRVGAFREFLEGTAQSRIRELVLEARQVAEEEVSQYLSGLKTAHWATLRAAVRRGGTFFGSRAINLPDDIAGKFQEPMAAVWSQKLLKDIRKRTDEFASDQKVLVEELCAWAEERLETTAARLIGLQRKRIARRAEQMKEVGKEAVTDLRKVVKQKLSDAIAKPIIASCDKFVSDGNDIGPGVKGRITTLFEELARRSTKSAEQPALRILQENFLTVRSEVRAAFDGWGDPLQETADLIVQRYTKHADSFVGDERALRIKEIVGVLEEAPVDVRGPGL